MHYTMEEEEYEQIDAHFEAIKLFQVPSLEEGVLVALNMFKKVEEKVG